MATAEDLLTRAFAGDAAARGELVRALAPVVQVRVYRALCARRRDRNVRQEVEDLTQDVLVALFRDDARVLRSWDPARGASLLNFVGLVAEREAARVLASHRRSPWAMDPTEDASLSRAAGEADGHETRVASRQLLDRVWRALKAELTPRGLELFRMLVLEERAVEEVCAELGMQPGAVYTWRNRLVARAKRISSEMEREMSGTPDGRDIPRERP